MDTRNHSEADGFDRNPDSQALRRALAAWPGLGIWALGWLAILGLDGQVDLANQAMVLILAAALSALWLPAWASMAAGAAAVLAFNWTFVPPRGAFAVDLHQHALLLGTMLVVSWIVAWLVARQRRLTERERDHALQAEQLRAVGEALRDTDNPIACATTLRDALSQRVGAPATLLMLPGPVPALDDPEAAVMLGSADADATAGLWLSLRLSRAFGPGTGHHAELDSWILPMRGRSGSLGAARLPLGDDVSARPDLRAHAQALCDQMGLALERAQAVRAAHQARDEAQGHKLRNTLLAAISHDYRTPLATILGAASALHDQAERLTREQQLSLAERIVDEVGQLSRLTDNTLQLARLDALGLNDGANAQAATAPLQHLQTDWESAEEIVGTVMRHARARDPGRRLRARVEPGLPLLRCDALLLVQMLDNLVDNALKYSDEPAPVELLVRRAGEALLLAVRDRGPGVPPHARARIFEVFQRGERIGDRAARRGAGVGLAVCQAIARAHGGDLSLRARAHGGASFECCLPLPSAPAPDRAPVPAEDATAAPATEPAESTARAAADASGALDPGSAAGAVSAVGAVVPGMVLEALMPARRGPSVAP